ncbi:MAG: hypothetical protein JW395_2854 [Nitrospira sp.]|nr:hypothetical protein [Nitrospira sp.]
MKPVELRHIGPGRKERISSQGQNLAAGMEKFARLLGQIVAAALDEIVRMLRDPGMIRRHVIRDEIQDQSHPPVGQLLPGSSKFCRPSQVLVHDVASHTIGRTDIVLCHKVRESSPEIRKQPLVLHRNGCAGGTPFPHAHEPDRIKTVSSKGVPFLIGNRGQGHGLPVCPAQLTQPDPGVDLIDDRIFPPGLHPLPFLNAARLPPSRARLASRRP